MGPASSLGRSLFKTDRGTRTLQTMFYKNYKKCTKSKIKNNVCKCASVCQHLFPESTFVLRLVFVVRLACRGPCRATHGFPCVGTSVPWVSLPGPTGVPQCPGCLCGKRPTLVVCLLVLLDSRRRVCLALMFVFVHHAHVRLRIIVSQLDWKCCPSSQSSPFSVLRIISTKFSAGCGCSLQLAILFEISSEFLLLAVCSVAIHLVHANANLFLSRFTDQCRMLSRLSLDISAIFAAA